MAYQSGQIIEASDVSLNDFNELADLVNEIYNDTHSGDFSLATGTLGYGQTPAVSPMVVGTTITAAQWTSLFTALHKCAVHQGTTIAGSVAFQDAVATGVTVGDIIKAFDDPNGLQDLLAAIKTNRLLIAPGESTATTSSLSEVRTAAWSAQVEHTFDISFADGDAARYFFNTGGELRWQSIYQAGTPEEPLLEESEWAAAASALGVVTMNYNNTTSGAGNTAVGYYNLSTTYAELANKPIGSASGYYTTEQIVVEAKVTDSNKNVIRFRIRFITDADADRILNGTLTSSIGHLVSSGDVVVTPPTYSTITFSGS